MSCITFLFLNSSCLLVVVVAHSQHWFMLWKLTVCSHVLCPPFWYSFLLFGRGQWMTRYFTVCENDHGNTKRRIHFLWCIVQSLWLTNRDIRLFIRLSGDHLKLDIVVSQGPTPSELWPSPGTLDPVMLWRGIRYVNLKSPWT